MSITYGSLDAACRVKNGGFQDNIRILFSSQQATARKLENDDMTKELKTGVTLSVFWNNAVFFCDVLPGVFYIFFG